MRFMIEKCIFCGLESYSIGFTASEHPENCYCPFCMRTQAEARIVMMFLGLKPTSSYSNACCLKGEKEWITNMM